jgi:hypothetical protein
MAITASVLLHLPQLGIGPHQGLRVESLDDCVLVHTSASFGSDPEQLAALLQERLGAALDAHQDARGLFVLPSVANPGARGYDALIAEVGAGGMWIDPPAARVGEAFAAPDGLGALGAVLGSMLQHMPQPRRDAASAAARGDMQGLSQVSDQVAALLGQAPPGGVDMASLMSLVSGGGLDVASPAFQQLLSGLSRQLERDPDTMQRLAEQLFGQVPDAGHDDDS